MIDLQILNQNMKIKQIELLEDIEGKDITVSTKMTFIDEEGFKYYLTQQNIISSIRKNGILARYFQKNPYTYENISNYLKLNDIPLKLLTKNPTTAICKLEWECLIHNNIFDRSWNVIKNGSVFCKDCASENFREKRCHTIEYVKEVALRDYDITIISEEYVDNETPLDFICSEHLEEGVQSKSWGNIITSSNCACYHCSKEIYLKKVTKTHEKFIEQVKEIHGDKYTVISKYESSNKHVQVYCFKCKSEFSIKASHLLEGHGCGICTKSKGEEQIKNTFDKNNINYIREYRFDDCRGVKRTLPFDFYLEQYNLLIEFQGIQHFKPVEIFGGQKQFDIQQINDNCKREYCKNKNIFLLEIPYWEEKNIESILLNKLKQLRKDAI